MTAGPIHHHVLAAIWLGSETRTRIRKLTRHFLQSPAIPGFAWIKVLELWILGAPLAAVGRMLVAAIALTLLWVLAFDNLQEVAAEAIED